MHPDLHHAQEWDPYETYEQERFLLEFASSDCNSVHAPKQEDETLQLFIQHQRSSSLISVPVSSSVDKPAKIHRVRSLPTPPTPAARVPQAAAYVPRPLLLRLIVPTNVTVNIAESPTFVLSASDFDSNGNDTDSFSLLSDAETHPPYLNNQEYSFITAKPSLSNFNLGETRYGERFMGSQVGVNVVKPDDMPLYLPSPCDSEMNSPMSSFDESLRSPTAPSPLPSIRLSQDSASVYSKGHSNEGSFSSLFTTTSSKTTTSRLRPLPKIPMVVPDRSRWVPPSAWKLDDNDALLGKNDEDFMMTEAAARPARPLSALDFLKEDYVLQVKEAKTPQKPQKPVRPKVMRRPGSAPGDKKRPPVTFDRSPLIALDKSRPEIQNFVKFHREALPSRGDLELAAKLEVISEDGSRVPFGVLFREQKTVVIFIRHFWCPLCQDYMYSLKSTASQDMLNQNGLNLIVIGNGSHSMIKSYRSMLSRTFTIRNPLTSLSFRDIQIAVQILHRPLVTRI